MLCLLLHHGVPPAGGSRGSRRTPRRPSAAAAAVAVAQVLRHSGTAVHRAFNLYRPSSMHRKKAQVRGKFARIGARFDQKVEKRGTFRLTHFNIPAPNRPTRDRIGDSGSGKALFRGVRAKAFSQSIDRGAPIEPVAGAAGHLHLPWHVPCRRSITPCFRRGLERRACLSRHVPRPALPGRAPIPPCGPAGLPGRESRSTPLDAPTGPHTRGGCPPTSLGPGADPRRIRSGGRPYALTIRSRPSVTSAVALRVSRTSGL